jgi:hypothetical protein
MAGTTSRKRKIAMALPRPRSGEPLKETRHISRASTLASSCTEPGAMISTRSNTLSTLMTRVIRTTARTGESNGTVTLRKTCHSVPPSTRAASSASRGIAASAAAMSTIANPAHIQM